MSKKLHSSKRPQKRTSSKKVSTHGKSKRAVSARRTQKKPPVSLPSEQQALQPLSVPKVEMHTPEIFLGEIDHYYGHIGVVTFELKNPVSVGDQIAIRGRITDFLQTVSSIQMNHKSLKSANKNDEVGIQVIETCHPGDKVFKLLL